MSLSGHETIYNRLSGIGRKLILFDHLDFTALTYKLVEIIS